MTTAGQTPLGQRDPEMRSQVSSGLSRRRLLIGAAVAGGAGLATAGLIPAQHHDAVAGVLPLFQRCSFGAYADNEPYPDVSAHYALESLVGARLGRMSWFQDMAVPWLDEQAGAAAATGHLIMIAWQPADAGVPIPFADILAGAWDTRLLAFFRKAAAYPYKVILRPFWEMNASAGAYSMNYTGADRQVNSTAQFIATWQYLVRLQRSVGGDRIRWFFCANGSDTGPYKMESYYPGTAFVDEVGHDVYNDDLSPWSSFEDRVSPMYERLAAIAPELPVTIGEIGCIESGAPAGQSKAGWTEQMFLCETFPQLKHISFFNADKTIDWRLNSSPSSLATCRSFLPRVPQTLDS